MIFTYRNSLIKTFWARNTAVRRQDLYNLIKIYKLYTSWNEDVSLLEDTIEMEDIRSRGYFGNKDIVNELYELVRTIRPYQISNLFEGTNSLAMSCENSLSDKIVNLYNRIEHWLREDIFEGEVFLCDRCEETYDNSEYDSEYEVCGSCADTYREEEEYENGEYHDDCSYEHEQYCSNYSTRVEERIGVKYREDETIDTNLNTTKALLYGVELEVMARNSMPNDFPETLTDYNNWFLCKRDGSLEEANGGFEICTAPSTFKFLKDRFSDMFNSDYWTDENGSTYVRGWNTECAGLHIHINKRALTPLEIGKLLVFINEKKNKRFVEDIAGRNMNRWCLSHPKNVKDGQYRNDDRYQAVNTSNRNTVELRIFRSNVSEYGFMRALEFTDALVHYLKQTSIREQSLEYKSFVNYMKKPEVRSEYPNFWNWLITNGYVLGTPSRSIARQFESVSNG